MAAVGLALSVAQTLFSALQCPQLKEICSLWGYQFELERLETTVSIINATLTEAEAKEELPKSARVWIEKLKDAVYDADDLLDEFLTLAQQKQLIKGGKVSKKVRLFFSRYNSLLVAYDMSREVKKIREKLNAIADDRTKFGFSIIDNKPIRRRRDETCSYVYANDIIGREKDTEKIVGMLLDSNAAEQHDVSFLTIVGIGGLGKTTLAQLVYNHERIKQEFGLRLWACVSDHNSEHLDVKSVLNKILESATKKKPDGSSMEQVQARLRKKLGGQKYLLVLDDVWSEDRDELQKLVGFLMGGLRGSWIMVTTRSRETARVVGHGLEYELQGLSENDSWRLFEMTAFEPGRGQINASDLVEIGREVVKKCHNVPLAIRVLGSLLYGQEKRKWLSFREIGSFAGIRLGENDVLAILKLSYHNLGPQLKSCFAFCALFPKDFVIVKEWLISLWMAHGYIVPLDKGQSIEDAAEEYFSILLKRCFFQDVKKDEFGEIITCKIHDLMHDIAQEVSENEICVVDSLPTKLDKRVRHLSFAREICTGGSFSQSKTRTSVCCSISPRLCYLGVQIVLPVGQLLENWKCLRALDLRGSLNEKGLPISVGELVHLRYLDISHNKVLKTLPQSIIKLHNLQTLDLSYCRSLKELPKNLGKLVNLRFLGIDGCDGLKHMPLGLGKLTSLNWLSLFAVGDQNSSSVVDQLENLKALTKLRGHLEIRMYGEVGNVRGIRREGGCLSSKERLNSIEFSFWKNENEENEREGEYEEEMLMEDLKPHPNLKGLTLIDYRGAKMPRWAREGNLATFLPNLVKVALIDCKRVRYLPSLGKLRHLKSLKIVGLSNLEYMEEEEDTWAAAESESLSSLFSSLEHLELSFLSKLNGWWRGGSNNRHPPPTPPRRSLWPSFPCLSRLSIDCCNNLTSVPLCSSVESLELGDLSKVDEIVVVVLEGGGGGGGAAAALLSEFNLRVLRVGNVGHLKLLPIEAVRNLTEMTIHYDYNLESMSEVDQGVLLACSSSLRSLKIEFCLKLRSLCGGGGLEHLTALETLSIDRAPKLTLSIDGITMQPWRSLSHSLRSLTLEYVLDLPKGIQYLTSLHSLSLYHLEELVNLPEWMQGLTSLRSLVIGDCKALESMQEFMRKLTSLTQLELYACSPRLNQRCQSPNGVDWPYICHIPHVFITEDYW